jgi:ribosome-associated heat shock protein Hsp15
MGAESQKLRIDKYLWAIRIFKTRSLATEACKAGRVKIKGNAIKPSYEVKIGDQISIQKGSERKVVQVTGLLTNRGDAKIAALHYTDITPVEETSSYQKQFNAPVLIRDRGTGRPTKKDRRELDDLTGDWFLDI